MWEHDITYTHPKNLSFSNLSLSNYLFMAEGLVSAVLEQRASILIQQVEAEVRLVVGVEYEVQNVTNFTAIKAALEEAEVR